MERRMQEEPALMEQADRGRSSTPRDDTGNLDGLSHCHRHNTLCYLLNIVLRQFRTRTYGETISRHTTKKKNENKNKTKTEKKTKQKITNSEASIVESQLGHDDILRASLRYDLYATATVVLLHRRTKLSTEAKQRRERRRGREEGGGGGGGGNNG